MKESQFYGYLVVMSDFNDAIVFLHSLTPGCRPRINGLDYLMRCNGKVHH